MTDISAAIGKRIRTFRNAQGISLEELSFKAGLNAAHLGQIERGLRNPTIETLNRIATALDISFYELIGSVEEVPQKQRNICFVIIIPYSGEKANNCSMLGLMQFLH